MKLDLVAAIPCGLIVNDLLTNSLKHGFPDGRSGEIRVSIECKDGDCKLNVSDNGVGLPDGFAVQNEFYWTEAGHGARAATTRNDPVHQQRRYRCCDLLSVPRTRHNGAVMSARILFVEDESIVQLDLQSRLKRLGYVVVGSRRGEKRQSPRRSNSDRISF
jgi:LytS/YehU family sensor histidine kinase